MEIFMIFSIFVKRLPGGSFSHGLLEAILNKIRIPPDLGSTKKHPWLVVFRPTIGW